MTVDKFKRAEKIMEEMNRWEEIVDLTNYTPCEIAMNIICEKAEVELNRLKDEFESL